jgi:hypothetical protein
MLSQRPAGGYPEHLRCFLHVPKSAGTSLYEALRLALPEASLSVKTNDTSTFCYGFEAFDELRAEARESLLVEERELADLSRSDIVFGHFSLPTLRRVASPASIATVLREPRSRLLSFYTWQRITPGLFDLWRPYRPEVEALRPLDEYLSEPQIAPETDNIVCRMLLHGDPRIPALDFISPDEVQGLAADAIQRLDELGFVGVLERGRTTWEGLSRFFGATLDPARVRVTGSTGVAAEALPLRKPISDRTLGLLEARTAADARVYTHALMAAGTETEARQISNASFAAQLIWLGDTTGTSAASAQSVSRAIVEAESRIAALAEELSEREQELITQREAVARLEAELGRRHTWLAGIQGSSNWRLTHPFRAGKRRLSGMKPS